MAPVWTCCSRTKLATTSRRGPTSPIAILDRIPAVQRGNESRQLEIFTVSDLWMVSKELPRGRTLGSVSQLAGAERVGDRLKSLGHEGARYVEPVNQVSEMRQKGGSVDWSRTKNWSGGASKLEPGMRWPPTGCLNPTHHN